MMKPPAEPGMTLEQVDTPALIVDLDPFERNLQRMADAVSAAGIRHRGHAKMHKSVEISKRQIAAGAVGMCCQKVSEAEVLVAGGVNDVLVSNQVVGERKVQRLVELARHARLGVCVDNADNIAMIAAAASDIDAQVGVLVELDVGANRCGVTRPEDVLALAQQVDSAAGLRFDGIQAYQGRAQHVRKYQDRRQLIDVAIDKARASVELLAQHGLNCATVGGAGTGTFEFESSSGVYNELQCGSYLFMDADYTKNLDDGDEFISQFEHSLFILANVMSTAKAELAVVDAGLKAIAFDSGMPTVHEPSGSEYTRPADEHGCIMPGSSNVKLELGDRVRLIPGHCDPTVNLHDWYVAVRDNIVEEVWRVDARGAVF